MKKDVVAYMDEMYPDKNFTFKVMSRRAKKSYPLNSMEINVILEKRSCTHSRRMKVDVHNPDVMLNVEIREEDLYIPRSFREQAECRSEQRKAMLLLSGGIDSPVAGYMVSKRGVRLRQLISMHRRIQANVQNRKLWILQRLVAKYSGPIKLHVVNFTDIQLYIYDQCPHDELTIIMRRYMMRSQNILQKRTDVLVLITGESIGQVASQTMQSLAATNEVCTLPVYRPLIGFDKQDIVDISEKINTYETSIQPFEDCCTIFVAKHPVTKPNIE